jgi:hypothetical protein
MRRAYGLHPVASRHDPRDASVIADRLARRLLANRPVGGSPQTSSPRHEAAQDFASAGTTEAWRTKQ